MSDEPDGLDRLQKLSPCDEPSCQDMRSYTGIWRSFWPGLIDGLFRLFIGLILILAGLYAILFWWGYSTMIDPHYRILSGGRSGKGRHSLASCSSH